MGILTYPKFFIARAIVTDPLIIIGDEPTGNLDENSSIEVLDLFEQLNREIKKTIIAYLQNQELDYLILKFGQVDIELGYYYRQHDINIFKIR